MLSVFAVKDSSSVFADFAITCYIAEKEEILIHLAVAAIAALSTLREQIWRFGALYHSTILYMLVCNLLYLVLTADHFLWAFVPDVHRYPILTELLYTFVVFPCTVILFLRGYPDRGLKVLLHYVKWVSIYGVVELVYFYTGRIEYAHGWNWYWSVGFDCVMFPMLRLHHKKPLTAYVMSLPFIVLLMIWFEVPLDQPSPSEATSR